MSYGAFLRLLKGDVFRKFLEVFRNYALAGEHHRHAFGLSSACGRQPVREKIAARNDH